MVSSQYSGERTALLVDSSAPQMARLSSVRDGQRERDKGRGSSLVALLTMERLRSMYPVAIFCVTSALLFADQNLMAPNLTDIAKSFNFDERERDKVCSGTHRLLTWHL